MLKPRRSYCQVADRSRTPARTLGEYLRQASLDVPSQVALAFEGRAITYRAFDEAADDLAGRLMALGMRHGDRVGICLPDWPEFTLLYYGCARLGLVVVPLSWQYRREELGRVLGHVGARLLVTPERLADCDYRATMEALRPQLPQLEYVCHWGDDSGPDLRHPLAPALAGRGASRPALQAYLRTRAVEPDDLLEVAYSSGTTGTPKGIMRTHRAAAFVALHHARQWGSRPDDALLSMVPVSHSAGCNHAQNAAVLGRLRLVYLGRWEPEHCLATIQRERPTVLVGVPTMYARLVEHPAFETYDHTSVRALWCAGAPLGRDTALRFMRAFDADLVHCYGTTETGGVHVARHVDRPGEPYESVGRPLGGMESKVVDPGTGRMVAVGRPGELCVRGPACPVGYFGAPSGDGLRDPLGWFHTGDLAVMDGRGSVHVVGRLKDMIVRGGQNIYAAEVEDLLCAHPDIAQAFVVGYPDGELGERTCAFLVPRRPDVHLERPDIASFFAGKVARYKIPDRVEMILDPPLTASGKVRKEALRVGLLAELRAVAGGTAVTEAGQGPRGTSGQTTGRHPRLAGRRDGSTAAAPSRPARTGVGPTRRVGLTQTVLKDGGIGTRPGA